MNLDFLIIFLPIIIGFFIGNFTKPDKWYFNLNKSIFTPPPYIFGIAWSILYILIGISYFLALRNKSFIYWIIPLLHLFINFIYTPFIFLYKKILESSFIVLLTLITAIITMILFYIYDNTRIAFYLFIPYIIWLIFANYLSWSLYYLN